MKLVISHYLGKVEVNMNVDEHYEEEVLNLKILKEFETHPSLNYLSYHVEVYNGLKTEEVVVNRKKYREDAFVLLEASCYEQAAFDFRLLYPSCTILEDYEDPQEFIEKGNFLTKEGYFYKFDYSEGFLFAVLI